MRAFIVAGIIAACCCCSGCSSVSDVVRSTWSPRVELCDGVEGKTIDEFRVHMGHPSMQPLSIGRGVDGARVYRFQQGLTYSELMIKNDVITSAECWRDSNLVAPSKRTERRFRNER